MSKDSPNPGAFWGRSWRCRTFAVFSYITYPRDESDKFVREFATESAINTERLSRFFNSQREWLTTFHFPEPFPKLRAGNMGELRSEFQIKLKPSQELDEYDRTRVFPTLVLWVRNNEIAKETFLDPVELIVEGKQFDLMQSNEATRFRTEFFVPSGYQFDPRLAQFIASSSLDVFA